MIKIGCTQLHIAYISQNEFFYNFYFVPNRVSQYEDFILLSAKNSRSYHKVTTGKSQYIFLSFGDKLEVFLYSVEEYFSYDFLIEKLQIRTSTKKLIFGVYFVIRNVFMAM